MSLSPRGLALLLAFLLAPALAFVLFGPDDDIDPAVAQNLPVRTSENVKLVGSVPGTSAISGVFSPSAPFFYVSGLDSISVIDVSDPKKPKLAGRLENVLFENEAMTYGERRGPDGKIQRFVLVGIDLVQASPSGPGQKGNLEGQELLVVDVTDPAAPVIRSRTGMGGPNAITTSTHTVACMNAACTIAYSSGSTDEEFSIIDLSDLDAPRQVKTVKSPAEAPNPEFGGGSGHYWNVDSAGIAWHTGSGGAAAFDISDPLNPRVLNTTNAQGIGDPYNNFIHHNSQRPGATSFRPGRAPGVQNGNVLIVTEEDYANPVPGPFTEGNVPGEELQCKQSGTVQTWEVDELDGQGPGSIKPLDLFQPVGELGTDQGGSPVSGFCSAHWFDFHESGIVAQGFYQQGLRLIDTRDPRNLKQLGFAVGGGQVWDAYWAPQRASNGQAIPGRRTNLVYTVDAVRGVDVFEVADLPAPLTPPGDDTTRGSFPASLPGGTGSGTGAGAGRDNGIDPATTAPSGGISGRNGCAAPSSVVARSSRLARRSARLSGTARAASGCRITKVRVAIGRKSGSRCRYLREDGTFGPLVDCRRTSYVSARGTTRWTLNRRYRLPRGSYLVWSRAIDSAGNVERKSRGRNLLSTRVRR